MRSPASRRNREPEDAGKPIWTVPGSLDTG
jgi:hypothetical protein